MAMFQPFKAATQRKGSAVNDLMMQQQVDAARREMQAQNLAGATSIAKWGLGKDTSPWADSLYGAEAAPTENALSTALRMEGPAAESAMSGLAPAATPAAEAGLLEGALATGAEGTMSGLAPSVLAPAAETGLVAGALPAAEAGVMSGIGASAVPAATTAATTGAAAGATPALAALGPIGMGIGGLLLARQLGVFG